jgi:hypothetical protein
MPTYAQITLMAVGTAILALLPAVHADAKQTVLSCKIEEGSSAKYDSTQIMIDEEERQVIYHFQLVGADPIRKLGEGSFVDLSMKITINNDKIVMANDASHVFVMTKHDAKFVHAFVMPIPTPDGNFAAFWKHSLGNVHQEPIRLDP